MLVVEDRGGEPVQERRRLDQALAAASGELARLSEDARQRSALAQSEIFIVHQAMLSDPDLLSEVVALIERGHGAGWSWQRVIGERVEEVCRSEDERLAGRAADLRDIGQRVLRVMEGLAAHELVLPAGAWILVADDLTPSDTARLDPQAVLGVCTASGGPTSHTAIIARARGLPAVVGAGERVLGLAGGCRVILDGGGGRIYPRPDQATLDSAHAFQRDWLAKKTLADQARFQPVIYANGRRIDVLANIASAEEAEVAMRSGAEGVGLVRTEFLFLGRPAPPDEEEQLEVYSRMVRAVNGGPLVVRTLDVGSDKRVSYWDEAAEENPALGVRGIRLCLNRPSVFETQLRAIYRAAAITAPGSVKILLPMITFLEELRAAQEMAESVRSRLGAPRCEIGVMVEVPSVAMMAGEFAAEADFFSVGTNDLTQYTLAVDRQHPELGKQADALHPAVLRLVDRTVRAAKRAGKHVAVCGGAAGDALGALILAGIGVDGLSMGAPSVAEVKAALREATPARLVALARHALACSTAGEVRALSL